MLKLLAKLRILFKISLLVYKTTREKQPGYLHSVLATLHPSCSLRSNKKNHPVGLQGGDKPRCETIWHLCPLSLEQPPVICLSATSIAIFKNVSWHMFDLVVSHRHQHTRWPVDAIEPCFVNFVIQHLFGYRVTQPLLIDLFIQVNLKIQECVPGYSGQPGYSGLCNKLFRSTWRFETVYCTIQVNRNSLEHHPESTLTSV